MDKALITLAGTLLGTLLGYVLSRRSFREQRQWTARERRYDELLGHLSVARVKLTDLCEYFQEPDSEYGDYSKNARFNQLKQERDAALAAIRPLVGPASVFLSNEAIAALKELEASKWHAGMDSVNEADYIEAVDKLVEKAESEVIAAARVQLVPEARAWGILKSGEVANMQAGVQLSEGVKIRAEIDNSLVKGLLLANGGGAVALLAFLKVVFEVKRLEPLAIYVIAALLIFHLGLVAALVHNKYRRDCSLVYENNAMRPPPGKLFGLTLKEPRVCGISKLFRFLSIAFFLLGGIVVSSGGLRLVLCAT